MLDIFEPMDEKQQGEALDALADRRAKAPKKINNADLPAGSSMFYYCNLCGAQHYRRSESDFSPVPKFCPPCQQMINAGWTESEQKFATHTVTTCTVCGGSGQQSERRRSFGRSYTKTWGCSNCGCSGKIIKRI